MNLLDCTYAQVHVLLQKQLFDVVKMHANPDTVLIRQFMFCLCTGLVHYSFQTTYIYVSVDCSILYYDLPLPRIDNEMVTL